MTPFFLNLVIFWCVAGWPGDGKKTVGLLYLARVLSQPGRTCSRGLLIENCIWTEKMVETEIFNPNPVVVVGSKSLTTFLKMTIFFFIGGFLGEKGSNERAQRADFNDIKFFYFF